MKALKINLARDFSRYPAGRLRVDGPHSGERFREDILVPAIRSHEKVTVNLDGGAGYGSSFLEEAFGGLLRGHFSLQEVKLKLQLESEDSSLPLEIWTYINDQAARA